MGYACVGGGLVVSICKGWPCCGLWGLQSNYCRNQDGKQWHKADRTAWLSPNHRPCSAALDDS